MPSIHTLAATAALLLAGLLAAPAPVRAAETYHTCTGFIDTLPATISTQGTWCLRGDLSTAITSGNAITISTNNVTIDCNDFKLGGLAAGLGTTAGGIYALDRLNATVRRCNIRGFRRGLYIIGIDSGGHVVEDNRFDGNTWIGVYVQGDGSVVRSNRVSDTGGSTYFPGEVFGIVTIDAVDILDNSVDGVLPAADANNNGDAYGIYSESNPSGSINGNRVRGVVKHGTGVTRGIYSAGSGRISLRDNDLSSAASTGSIGLRCNNTLGRAKDNIVNGFATAIQTCSGTDNEIVP